MEPLMHSEQNHRIIVQISLPNIQNSLKQSVLCQDFFADLSVFAAHTWCGSLGVIYREEYTSILMCSFPYAVILCMFAWE